MDNEHSDFPRPGDEPSRRPSPQPPSSATSTGNATASTLHEEKDHISSLSHNSSPRITSILLTPSEKSPTRPRSSDGRVTSLNLPKHSTHPARTHINSLGTPRKRVGNNISVGKQDLEERSDGKLNVTRDDGLLNFGLGDELSLEPEDPHVLEDVQRALKAKALRESRARPEIFLPASLEASSSIVDASRPSANLSTLAGPPAISLPITPPKPAISISTRPSPSSMTTLPKITFPSYVHSPSRSLESISSDGPARSPLPNLVYSQDGTTYLDWSGAIPERTTPERGRSLLGRTFSLTKRKTKDKDRIRGLTARNSLDFRASQGDLHAATLDSIRRTARRDTLSRAETTKDELGRRYASLSYHKPTGEPILDVLDAVKSRPDITNIHTPWLAWCRQLVLSRQKANVWTLTADSVDEYLQKSGRFPTRPSIVNPSVPVHQPVSRSHSPSYRLSSPLSSPRSSFSNSPLSHNSTARRDRKRMELSRSLSANPVVESVSSTSPPLLRTLSRSLSLTQTTSAGSLPMPSFGQRRSIDVVINTEPRTASFTNLNDSPRSSFDRGSEPQPLQTHNKGENSVRKRFHGPLSIDPTSESHTSTVSSITNLFGGGNSHGHGVSPASSRLHLGVGNMFGRMRRSGDEGEHNGRSRSSVSDERDSAKEGECTKSDDAAGSRGAGRSLTAPGLGLKSRGRDASNTSDSELGGPSSGLLTARIGRRFRKSEKDRDRDRSVEDTTGEIARESISGGEQWQVDALAGPGWTSRRGVRRARMSTAPKEIGREKLREMLRKQEEEEERSKEIYKTKELLLAEANDHNRKIARLLKTVCASIREHEEVQSELGRAVGFQYKTIPSEVLDAISADPATTLRHGKGWRAVEDSHQRFNHHQALLAAYLSFLTTESHPDISSDLGDSIHEAEELWRGLQDKSEQIEQQAGMVKSALKRAVSHMKDVQKEYNDTQMLVETDYPEQSRITDLEMIITESRAPRGWLEFAAVWIPEHVLEFIGGFIRFFGVPISEKFIRPFLWYFFRNRYYWKIYSTEPPPSERAWYTRLGYWIVVLSILAWYTTS